MQPDAHDALMDERSEHRYDGTDEREQEERDRYMALGDAERAAERAAAGTEALGLRFGA